MATSRVEEKGANQEIPVAVFAALRQEMTPLRRRACSRLALITTGLGFENADRGVRSWLRRRDTRVVLGIGFAGGLSASLQIGDLVIAREVLGMFKASPTRELLQAAEKVFADGLVVRFGTVMTVKEVLCESRAKRSLAMSLDAEEIGCVDMESAAIAQTCSEYRIPFLIARCITDRLDENLPLDFNRCRDPHGNIKAAKVMRAALLRPGSFSGLWEVRRRSQRCGEKLALFVEELLRLEELKIYSERA
jgi:adenosylhomocysteine nucleosidase